MSRTAREAWITLATNDTYAVGALVLATSLHCVNTNRRLCIMVAPDVSNSMKRILGNVFDEVIVVDVLDSKDAAHLALMSRPELGITFTKIHCWSCTRYNKAVFLDADTLVIKNCDELFDHDELSAVTDVGWPDIFNSGVFVFRPSKTTFQALLTMAVDRGSFDGGDQGLINQFFRKWNRLSFIYNMVSAIAYTYLPAYKHYGKDTKIVHFLGARKPWEIEAENDGSIPRSLSTPSPITEYLLWWWTLFLQNVQPQLFGDDLRGFAARFAARVPPAIVLTHAQLRRLAPPHKPDGFDAVQRRIAESIRRGAQRTKDALAASSRKPPEKPPAGGKKPRKSEKHPPGDQKPLLADAEQSLLDAGVEMTKKKRRRWCCCGGTRQGPP